MLQLKLILALSSAFGPTLGSSPVMESRAYGKVCQPLVQGKTFQVQLASAGQFLQEIRIASLLTTSGSSVAVYVGSHSIKFSSRLPTTNPHTTTNGPPEGPTRRLMRSRTCTASAAPIRSLSTQAYTRLIFQSYRISGKLLSACQWNERGRDRQ